MSSHILVAYATRAGSTEDIAEYVGRVLRDTGATVDVQNVKHIQDVSGYDALILGSAIRNSSVLPEAVHFLTRFRKPLAAMDVAYFIVCLTMAEDTPENRQKADVFLKPLCNFKQPISKGLFAGAVNHARLGWIWRFLLRNAKDAGALAEADHLNWGAIEAWAKDLFPVMVH